MSVILLILTLALIGGTWSLVKKMVTENDKTKRERMMLSITINLIVIAMNAILFVLK